MEVFNEFTGAKHTIQYPGNTLTIEWKCLYVSLSLCLFTHLHFFAVLGSRSSSVSFPDFFCKVNYFISSLKKGGENLQGDTNAFYYGLNICVPTELLCWNLNAHVIILGGGTFGRSLSGRYFDKRDAIVHSCPFHHGRMQQEDGPFVNQGAGSHQEPNHAGTDLGLSATRTGRNKFLWLISPLSAVCCNSSLRD